MARVRNYRRGFLRIYVILSILWILIRGLTAFINQPDPSYYKTLSSSARDSGNKEYFVNRAEQTEEERGTYWILMAAEILGVPTLSYVACFVLLPWISLGFRSQRERE